MLAIAVVKVINIRNLGKPRIVRVVVDLDDIAQTRRKLLDSPRLLTLAHKHSMHIRLVPRLAKDLKTNSKVALVDWQSEPLHGLRASVKVILRKFHKTNNIIILYRHKNSDKKGDS